MTNMIFVANDTTYFTHRFSAFGVRSSGTTDSVTNLNFTELKAEVVPVATQTAPTITSKSFSPPSTFSLTWTSVADKFYILESTPTISPAAWVTNAVVAATGSSTSVTLTNETAASTFYRILAPAQP